MTKTLSNFDEIQFFCVFCDVDSEKKIIMMIFSKFKGVLKIASLNIKISTLPYGKFTDFKHKRSFYVLTSLKLDSTATEEDGTKLYFLTRLACKGN